MTMTDFLIFAAPQLVLISSVVFAFVWGAKGKTPSFLENAQPVSYEDAETAAAENDRIAN
ncbi:cytochrome bd oxidase small subunit CydS [Alkalicoccus urumqiensis]|uniref:Uncharacterized protein n=1 Tax=Alkalicoccus urumqiensis TaxID=1548213 RepID=A0A2P6MEH4_ALKUR|nr:hypothetical protein [Alkalicoccus urumqiensis]PRO64666.1 hypothetical protein C6I21_13240 [Alkalicoccus urumqiensis]